MTAARAAMLRMETRAARTAIGLGAIALLCACGAPRWFPIAYRLAIFSCLAPALGSLILVLIHRITGGQWTAGLAPFLLAGIEVLPWVWLLALPLLALPLPWARMAAGAPVGYESTPFVLARAVAFAALLFLLRHWLRGGVGVLKDPMDNPRPWVGPVGLILIFFALTLMADDWLESLEPGWHSTAFPVVWMASQVVSGLALALLCGLGAGAEPARLGAAQRSLGIDWGNLLLATMMFWVYVTFCQFLIIWSGNLPEEISWYVRRERGGWIWFAPAVAFAGFAVPFGVLLMRKAKRSSGGLAAVAALVLISQWAYLVWVIVPAQGGPSLLAAVLIVTLAGSAAALFANRYARAARQRREFA